MQKEAKRKGKGIDVSKKKERKRRRKEGFKRNYSSVAASTVATFAQIYALVSEQTSFPRIGPSVIPMKTHSFESSVSSMAK